MHFFTSEGVRETVFGVQDQVHVLLALTNRTLRQSISEGSILPNTKSTSV